MKLFVAGIAQETNSFSPHPTDMSLFKRGYWLEGEQLRSTLEGTNTEIGGFFAFAERHTPEVQLIPGFAAWAIASGPLTTEALDQLSDRLLTAIKKSGPVEGLLLALHGALVGAEIEDCEGWLLERVRATVGPRIPIVCTLDTHALVTPQMITNADMLIGYRTYPHVDMGLTGERGAQALVDLIEGKPAHPPILHRVSMILPVDNTETSQGPFAEVIDRLEEWEGRDGILSTSYFCTHPWLDVDGHGIALLAYPEPALAPSLLEEMEQLGQKLWEHRAEFFSPCPEVKAFFRDFASYEKPVIAIDSGDITSAGGVGDSTVILRALLDQSSPPRSILPLVDPVAVDLAWAAGEGARIECEVGGHPSADYNKPVAISARIARLASDPIEVKGRAFSGLSLDMGRRALLEISPCIHLLATEYSSLMHDPQMLRSMGVHPEDYDLIVQKSHKLFRPAYAKIAKTIVMVDTPGTTDRNIQRLPFKNVQRPIYPLDEITDYEKASGGK